MSSTKSDNVIANKFKPEQIRLVYKQTPDGSIGSLLCAYITGVVLSVSINQCWLWTWLSLVILLGFLRYIHIKDMLRDSVTDDILLQSYPTYLVIFGIYGFAWGGGIVFIMPNLSIDSHTFIFATIAAMVAASVAKYSARLEAVLVFSLPTMAPLTIFCFWVGSPIYTVTGLLSMLYMVILIDTAKQISEISFNSLLQRFYANVAVANRKPVIRLKTKKTGWCKKLTG